MIGSTTISRLNIITSSGDCSIDEEIDTFFSRSAHENLIMYGIGALLCSALQTELELIRDVT